MENLQKIVVLCAVLIIGIFVGAQFVDAPIETEDGMTQIDPPSLDTDAGPDDVDIDESQNPDKPDSAQPAPVACTKEAKACPDGTFVSRTGPNCEFEACPVHEVPDDDFVACTMDAKQCPDGSYVGRVAPTCAFAPCPTSEQKSITCSPESKQVQACTRIYKPVCGMVQVQCITTPCDPIPETFGNACDACSQGNVISYTEGACEADA